MNLALRLPRLPRSLGTGLLAVAASAAPLLAAVPAAAQEQVLGHVNPAWNRYYDYEEMVAMLRDFAEAYPGLMELRTIGRSGQGREILLAIVTDPETGPHDEKPAIWIDGNVHGNEVQATEVVLYTLWYLLKSHGTNEQLTEMLRDRSFYLVPSVNPDGRAYWFAEANTSSSSRTNHRPEDDDRDGLVDEDPYNDLDGDGSITRMWKADPNGDWIRDEKDPRIFRRVEPGERGEWTSLGREGIDDDGDGRTDEDGPFADDMNRNWPGDWQPPFVQRGAGDYPLSNPETRCIAEFILAHPNIAAGQSYHNTGGMILRGPGTDYMQSAYPREDLAVYDSIGREGEKMLPGYDLLVIFDDLYNVHGGFITWMSESLGVIGFTNELWTWRNYFYRPPGERMTEEDSWFWRDRIAFGDLFTDYTEVEHPEHGTVLVGGPNKWSSRSTPVFMLEEECHRNFAFTMLHADEMPKLRWGREQVEAIAPGTWSVTVEIENERRIPTRTARAARIGAGAPDLLTTEVRGGTIVAAGRVRGLRSDTLDPVDGDPGRIAVDEGIPSLGSRFFRFVVQADGDARPSLRMRYESEKAVDLERRLRISGRE